jgi:hypothetical protein
MYKGFPQFELAPEFETLFNEYEVGANRNTPQYIKWIQASLNQILGSNLAVDGVMGRATRNAIRSFQTKNGLTSDGIVGYKTEKTLGEAVGKIGRSNPAGFSIPLFDSWSKPQKQKIIDLINDLQFKKKPLPNSLNEDFIKAAIRIISILSSQSNHFKNETTKGLICVLKKLMQNETDDRIIMWSRIRPQLSNFTEDRSLYSFSPINENILYKYITSKSDVERSAKLLYPDSFFNHLRVEILYLHLYFNNPSEDIKILQFLQDLYIQRNLTTYNLYRMSGNDSFNFQNQFGSGIPKYYEAIKNWIAGQQTNPYSTYFCGQINENSWF